MADESATIYEIEKALSDSDWKSITEIARKTKHSASTVSKYLGIMKERGAVEVRKEATMKKFRLKKSAGEGGK